MFRILLLTTVLSMIMILGCENEKNKNHSHDQSNSISKEIDNHMNHDAYETSFHDMSVEMKITQDMMTGVNIQFLTSSFVFAPENVNKVNKDGEGHAHLYIDDNKWGRIYGEYVHIGTLSTGKHSFKVTLNTNKHDDYTHHGEVISDLVEFEYK